MHDLIKISHHLLMWCLLRVHLKMVDRNNTITGISKNMNAECDQLLMAGLVSSSELPDMKIMGAVLNPLFQCDASMVEAGLCTWKQFQAGKELLLGWTTHYYDCMESVENAPDKYLVKKTNKRSKLKYPTAVSNWPVEHA